MELQYFIKTILFLPFILILIYLSLKYGGTKLQNLQNGRYIKVLERVSLSKENSLIIVKIGEKGYVITSSQGKIEILMEIPKNELESIQASNKLPEYKNFKDFYNKLMIKKEEKNEKKI